MHALLVGFHRTGCLFRSDFGLFPEPSQRPGHILPITLSLSHAQTRLPSLPAVSKRKDCVSARHVVSGEMGGLGIQDGMFFPAATAPPRATYDKG